MLVERSINFNGKMVSIIGEVIGAKRVNGVWHWLVDFEHKKVEFRGWWEIV
jgi:hypothetical protein